MKYRHNNSNINVCNLVHGFVEQNITPNVYSEAGISYWLHHTYIY